nr:hypothetical protein CPGR_04926 [Mycolicibacterium malmesburyense]
MHHRHKHMLILVEAKKRRTQGYFVSKVEAAANRGGDSLGQLLFRPACRIDYSPTKVDLVQRDYHLLGYAFDGGESGSQAFVTAYHIDQCRTQRVSIERAGDPESGGQIVDWRRPLELVQEPQPLLAE